MNAGTDILERLLALETVSESADGAVRVTVGGQRPAVVELDGAVGRYSTGALGSLLADVATDAFTRHDAATVELFASAGPAAGAGSPDAWGGTRPAERTTAVRAVVDSPGGLVTIELTSDRRVGAWITARAMWSAGTTEAGLAAEASAALAGALAELARRLRTIHRGSRRYRVVAVAG
jgi:hypothetical protein